MCGLFGIAGLGIGKNDLKAFRNLGIVTQVRGLDGAGVYTDKLLGSPLREFPYFVKSEYDFCDLLAHNKEATEDVMADVMIGHCRAATAGKVNEANCHPFKVGNLVMAHNGTLLHQDYIWDTSRTDSEQMVEDMESDGIKTTLEKLSNWDAYAITGVDTEKKELYFARNEHRTLYVAIHQKRSVIYWASEKEILELCLDRCGVGPYSVFNIGTDILHTVKLDDIKTGATAIFHQESINYTNPWGYDEKVKKFKCSPSESKDDTQDDQSDNKSTCVRCRSDLIQSDWTWGLWSDYYGGQVCEMCSYGMRQHNYVN